MESIVRMKYKCVGRNEFDNHKHVHNDTYEIIQMFEGGGSILIKDRIYPLTYGGIYFINAINIHMTNPCYPDKYTRSIIVLNSKYAETLLSNTGARDIVEDIFIRDGGAYFALDEKAAIEADMCIKSICDLMNETSESYTETLAVSYLLRLIADICRGRKPQNGMVTENPLISFVLDYINRCLYSELSVDMIARNANISKYHLCRLFKKETGITIMKYILERRLSSAKKQLLYSDFPVSEISLSSGFGSFAYFSRIFKENEGVTPSEFRRRAKH